LLLVAGITGGLTLRPVLDPKIDRPSHADAIVMLSGDRGERLPTALRLLHDGFASTLVIDGVPDLPEAKALCTQTSIDVVCLDPQPDKTRSEARAAAELARKRGWQRLIVVTDKVHVSRARLLFERCVEGAVTVVAAPTPPELRGSWRAAAHEWLGLADAYTLSRSC
jgi:uncharacterized SAM-binding protein YcdF (DUF218 family)